MKYFCACLFFLLSCKVMPIESLNQQLIGIWQNKYDPHFSIEFTSDGYFHHCIGGETTFENITFYEDDENGKLKAVNYGFLKYELEALTGDSILIKIIGTENKKVFSESILILKENELIEIGYKTMPGIENHIDELAFYKKEGTKSEFSQIREVEKIIVPKGYLGFIQIAYNQLDGTAPDFDKNGYPILNIPIDGNLKTQLKENLSVLAADRYEFYERDSITDEITPLRNFQHGELRTLSRKISNLDEQFVIKYPLDSTALFVYGFNQIGRDYLKEDYFKEKINGNIVSFEIDTIRERLGLDDYSKEMKN